MSHCPACGAKSKYIRGEYECKKCGQNFILADDFVIDVKTKRNHPIILTISLFICAGVFLHYYFEDQVWNYFALFPIGSGVYYQNISILYRLLFYQFVQINEYEYILQFSMVYYLTPYALPRIGTLGIIILIFGNVLIIGSISMFLFQVPLAGSQGIVYAMLLTYLWFYPKMDIVWGRGSIDQVDLHPFLAAAGIICFDIFRSFQFIPNGIHYFPHFFAIPLSSLYLLSFHKHERAAQKS